MFGQYQTIIVGAGPAGLLAGRYLGNSLILEKKKEIGKPVQCGEAISRRALAFQDIKPSSDWVCCEIHRLARIMPNGKSMGAWHKKPIGYVIDRDRFEKHLAGNCQAEIKLNTEVVDLSQKNNLWEVITKNGEVFRAKYVIGADGPFSIVRRKVFPENEQKIDFIPAIEYLVETERD
jgi:digeranylgeranylglycerophospholipid reductase